MLEPRLPDLADPCASQHAETDDIRRAPILGRVPLACGGDGVLRMQSWFYCLTNRNYVVPEMKAAAENLAEHIAAGHPGTVTLALDGNFPFLTGFPVLDQPCDKPQCV